MSTIGKEAGHSPTPWEVVPSNRHHGPYIVNAYGADVADLYTMSNPTAASVRNGGESYPVPFTDADANAEFIARAVNAHDELVAALDGLLKANDAVQDVLCDGPEVPGFDPTALGRAQSLVTEAETVARLALSRAKGEA